MGGQWSPSRRRLDALVVIITSDIASGEYNIDYWVIAAQLSVCGTLADMSSSDGRPELVSGQRWEARARVDFPLHYLIWLREHKLLEEKLEATGSGQQPAVKVNCVSTLLKRTGVLRITPDKKKVSFDLTKKYNFHFNIYHAYNDIGTSKYIYLIFQPQLA